MEFNIDTSKVPERTVLLFGIKYPGRNEGRVYTYTMIKAGGMWYVSGGDLAPQAAGWGAVKNWLAKDGRQVVYVKIATEFRQLWPKPDDLPAEPVRDVPDEAKHEFRSGLVEGSCHVQVMGLEGVRHLCGKTPTASVHRVTVARSRGSEWRERTRTPEDEALGYNQD